MSLLENKGNDFASYKSDEVNLKDRLVKQLPSKDVEMLVNAGKLAQNMGVKCYLVGGTVRDLVLKKRCYDIDLTVDGDGLAFAEQFTKFYGKRMKSFAQFGTAFVVLKTGKKIDISTSRTEVYTSPGSLPKVKYGEIEYDLYRRDFTINSMAISVNPEDFGRLLDFHSGVKDLKAKVIRILNDQSFEDDPLRVLRAIRFEQRLGFDIENRTKELMMKSIESNCLKTVSAERVYTELIVSTNKGDAAKFITRLSELGILRQIHKSLYFDELKAEQAKELSKLLEWFVKEYPQDKIEKWYPFHLILFSGLPKDMQTSIAKQLTYPSNFIKSISKIKLFLDKIDSGELKDSTDGELALKLSGLRIEDVLYLLAVVKDDELKSRLRHYLTHSRSVSLSINGHDLLMMGVTLGALIGSILQTLKIQKIDGKISNREDELELAKKMVDDDSDSATNLE